VRKKISTTVYLSHEQLRELTTLSVTTCIPQAAIIRAGIDHMLTLARDRPEMLARHLAGTKAGAVYPRRHAPVALPALALEDET
jgi:hypothetical protein